ncbi:MAG TPA: ADOP family duplicated permease, partial [Vicinamibacterales bacterium]|nr:ADOP family duplicated permease [Vicinamibacterales bacterium]
MRRALAEWASLDRCWLDVRWALRTLGHSPGFTSAVVLTLALGIGTNTAIFAVVNAVLLRPLPYPDAGRLVQVFEVSRVFGRSEATAATFAGWRDGSRTLERLEAFTSTSLVVSGPDIGEAEELAGGRVSPGFFGILGVRAHRGRLFESGAGDASVALEQVVVSHGVWLRLLGARDSAVGRTITLGGRARTVVGVLPPGFRFEPLDSRHEANAMRATEVWLPLAVNPTDPNAAGRYDLRVVGKLERGATIDEARAELAAIARRTTGGASSADVALLQDEIVHGTRTTLLLLFGAVVFVLVIACTNVAHLQLARSMTRGREMAIRLAIGAGRGSLARQLLVESLVVALAGGALGLLAARLSLGLLVRLAGPDLPRAVAVGIDPIVMGFTCAVACAVAISFGSIPALQASAVDPNRQLRERDAMPLGGRRGARLMRVLVAGETGLALVLAVCAGLMLASLWRVQRVDLGFRADHLLTLRGLLSGQSYRGEAGVRFFMDVVADLRRLPGVDAVAAANVLPMGGVEPFQGFVVEGSGLGAATPAADRIRGQYRTVTPGYFEALGIPLRRGRAFTDRDRAGAPLVAIVNETAERRHFGGSALGQRLYSGRIDQPIEVIGVVGDVRHAYARAEPLPEVYYPVAQAPSRVLWLVLRTSGDPMAVAPLVKATIRARDPAVPVDHVQTMDDRHATSLGIS